MGILSLDVTRSLQISRKSIVKLSHRSRCYRPTLDARPDLLPGSMTFPSRRTACLIHVYFPVGYGRQSKRGTKAVFLLSLFFILINLHGKNQAPPRRSQSDHFLRPSPAVGRRFTFASLRETRGGDGRRVRKGEGQQKGNKPGANEREAMTRTRTMMTRIQSDCHDGGGSKTEREKEKLLLSR